MEYNLINLKTYQLDKNLIESICKLKNSHWKTTIKLQKEFFTKNCKKIRYTFNIDFEKKNNRLHPVKKKET